MASYGQPLNYGYDPARDSVYPLFTSYFENPRMFKIKDIGIYSMYMSKIHALLGVEFRYLIVFVPKNNLPNKDEKFLSQLEWESLQTRTLTDDHNLPYHSYTPRRMPELDKKIWLKNKDDTQYVYSVEQLPIQIILLPRSKSVDYNASGTIVPALETYQTLVNFASA
jgi:hypothetical protein